MTSTKDTTHYRKFTELRTGTGSTEGQHPGRLEKSYENEAIYATGMLYNNIGQNFSIGYSGGGGVSHVKI